MPCANTLGETPNPPPPDLPVATPPVAAAPLLTRQDMLRAQAALIRLVTLAIVLAVLDTLGFRIRRDRRRRATPTPHPEPVQAPAEAACPKAPARLRPTYRYLDRASWVAMLDGIAQDMAPMALPPDQPAAVAASCHAVAPQAEEIPAIIAPPPRLPNPAPIFQPFREPAPRPLGVAPPPHVASRQNARLRPTIQPRPYRYDIKTIPGPRPSLGCAPPMP